MAKSSIKFRAKAKDGVVTVKALITHPMETGLRKDKKTGKVIPAKFIQTVKCEANGKSVMEAEWGVAISKNPYLSFKFKGAVKGGSIEAVWRDNKGESGKTEIVIR